MATANCEPCKSSFETDLPKPDCPLCGQPAEVDMAVRVICTCGTTLKAPPKLRGRVVKCPKCTRSVNIPRGDEEEQAKSSTILGRIVRWGFALALLPILVASHNSNMGVPQRIKEVMVKNPKHPQKQAIEEAHTLREQVKILGRLHGAHEIASGPMSWVYGGLSLCLFLAVLMWVFKGNKVGLGAVAGLSLPAFAVGLGFTFLILLIMPTPASGETAARAFIFALLFAAVSELVKGYLVASKLQKEIGLFWKDVALLGMAAGVGYGAGEAIPVALAQYRGAAPAGAYLIQFISVVGFHAALGGITAILLWKARETVRGASWTSALFKSLGMSLVLRFVFELFYRNDQQVVSLMVALAGFGVFHWLHWWSETNERDALGAQTIRL